MKKPIKLKSIVEEIQLTQRKDVVKHIATRADELISELKSAISDYEKKNR